MSTKNEVIKKLREDIAEYSKRSYMRHLVSGTGGNISVKVPDSALVLITPTGISLAEIEPDMNLLVDFEGNILENPLGFNPSKETSFHLVVYRIRPDVGAVAHLHPPYATAFSNKGETLPLLTINSRIALKDVPCIECALPGSRELCDFVKEGIMKFKSVNAFLMKEHGILTLGPDLKSAFYTADLVEDTAKIALFTEILEVSKKG
ncbi:MAG: class II aldolase/adducin family protein [Syntrophorhabdaceae bacterium]|nr:class II aldolase/adducin family protein [Syntrophorhabdaceae bacterium]